ncbi:MAG: undecaprenyl-diphosphate phosphatase [Candidatus Anstonellaceae archaeon]
MDLLQAFILGTIQGFSEWLPISSSAHLVLFQNFFDLKASAEFDIIIMLGTTFALILYFRKKLLSLFLDLLAFKKEAIEYLFFLVIAGLFTAFIGFPLKNFFKSFFYLPQIVCLLLILNGILIFLASKTKESTNRINKKIAILVGIAQAFSLFPGISRSGSTISVALLSGLNRLKAAEFSFLLGIPSMLIASLVELNSAIWFSMDLSILLAGISGAFLAGYLSIHFFFKILKEGNLVYFAYYSILIGSIFFVYFISL